MLVDASNNGIARHHRPTRYVVFVMSQPVRQKDQTLKNKKIGYSEGNLRIAGWRLALIRLRVSTAP
ncbi:hypothetical protein KCP78_20565 [Salmonella enterica subsp. enterica]|nr:hypothetical protein KCP78_20565 [Salmonella enterica subsp. enterica]